MLDNRFGSWSLVRRSSCPKVLLHHFPQFSVKWMEGERGNCELNGRGKAEGNGCWVSVLRKWEMRCQSYGVYTGGARI
jgi:hypothetical protein